MRGHGDLNAQPGVNDQPLIVLPCYEPAGTRIELTEAELREHLLVIGSTGSGKTTLLWDIVAQLVPQGVGLLLLDAKVDGLAERFTELARRCGRERDLVRLGPAGTHAIDLFGRIQGYEDIELVSQRVLLATDPLRGENAYWQNTSAALIAAALTLLCQPGKPFPSFRQVVEFMRCWFVGPGDATTLSGYAHEVVERAKREAKQSGASPQLSSALDQVAVWRHLDTRTRSNLQSCLLNVLRPFFNAAAGRCFETEARPRFHPAEVASEARLCIASINALTHCALAGFILRLVRREFFDAVQARGAGDHQLCGLVADEFALIAQREDVDQLATLRSKKCFVLAATQGLASLDERLGPRLRKAVVLNFNTIAFMRTREEEAGDFAMISLGQRPPPKRRAADWSQESLLLGPPPVPEPSRLVCPLGALGRLQAHQAFVVKADGSRTLAPVWFAPDFERDPTQPVPTKPDASRFTVAHALSVMARAGREPLLSVEEVSAALKFSGKDRRRALEQAITFFRAKACMIPTGLETLPTPWLAGLPGILWSLRQAHWSHLPFMLNRVACVDGVLLLSFAQESEEPSCGETSWDRLRLQVNQRLYPGRWRRLKLRHRPPLPRWRRITPGLS